MSARYYPAGVLADRAQLDTHRRQEETVRQLQIAVELQAEAEQEKPRPWSLRVPSVEVHEEGRWQ